MLILVADDQIENREMLARRLVRKGFSVIEACDGADAIAQWRRHGPHMILMDISMPVCNGLEATQEIRRQQAEVAPVIIALTAHAMESMRLDCMAAGCDAFATKPVDFASLLALIASFASSIAGKQDAADAMAGM